MQTTITAKTARRLDAALAAIAAAQDDVAVDHAADQRDAIVDEIERAPAATIADLILKAKAIKALYPDCPAFEPDDGATQDIRIASQIVDALAALALASTDALPVAA